MTTNTHIDWGFIYKLEGGLKTSGYVPTGSTLSGVTIGAGFDLGQYTIAQLMDMPLAEDLKRKLVVYTTLKGDSARKAISSMPLSLTMNEVRQAMGVLEDKFTSKLSSMYNGFDSIIPQAQTVIMSVEWQYGDIHTRCPKFWAACVSQDWDSVVLILENFGDKYSSRRKQEAAYLKGALNG